MHAVSHARDGRGRLGEAALAATGLGMLLAGATILVVGMTRVFVPQDLAFMGLTVGDLQAANPRLPALSAHDRAGFGGGLLRPAGLPGARALGARACRLLAQAAALARSGGA